MNVNSLLLDSDVIIFHLRKKKRLSDSISKKELFISIITYIELVNGAKKSKSEKEEQKITSFLADFSVSVIDLNLLIADIFVTDRISLEVKGNRLDNFDLFISATAKASNLPLFTYNKRHFKRIPGLKLY